MRTALTTKAFTPSREDPSLLDDRTTGRDGLLKRIRQMLVQTATTKNRPHMLLVGPRGAGKSHVLEVALHRASTDSELVERFRVARLPEDALGLASTADVLLQVLKALAPGTPVTQAGLDARRRGDVSTLQMLIEAELDGLPLLLVAENLNLTLRSLGDDGQADLRGWIEQSGSVTVLASAPLLFHAVQSRDAPFFGSFAIEHLDPLTMEQGTELLQSIAIERNDPDLAQFLQSPAGRLRIRAVHHLAGGSPRVWTIFASCISIESLTDVVPAIENLLEELVGYYQQRMWELSPTEQKIVSVLATTGPSQTVTSIANQAGVQRDTANTLLRRLAKAGWVQSNKIPGLDGRESWYELSEPLLRHHLQYRNNQGDDLRLIVDLLIAWFDSEQRSAQLLLAPTESTQSHYFASALTLDPTPSDPTSATDEYEPLVDELSDQLGATHPDTLNRRRTHAQLLGEANRSVEALRAYRSILNDSADDLTTLIAMARLQVRGGLAAGADLDDAEPLALLRAVALDGDANAFARLPASVRDILVEGNPTE